MKKLLVLGSLLFTVMAFAGNKGHVHFQSGSTWVNPLYNKSLCVEGDMFRADVNVCTKTSGRDGDHCMQWGKKRMYQPMMSSRMVCARSTRSTCVEYKMVDYNQSSVRYVTIDANRGNTSRTVKVVVPNCK